MKKENIRILLCRIWSPGNVGSILRSMKNFDYTDVVSLNQMNFDEEDTLTMCAGAKDHFRYLRHGNDLKKEVKDLNVIYAFTARRRKYYKIITPWEMAEEIAGLPENSKVGLMFGNETNGLLNEETDLCDKLVMIPTSENYSSLNVSSAAMIALYEISKQIKKQSQILENELIDHEKKEYLIEAIDKIVQTKLMERSDNKAQIKENVRNIFRRLQLNKKEEGFLRSIFEIVDRKINI